ncbi:MAG: glycosyltransferase [Candidatus Aenigmatarchaeota archaeon]
MKILAVFPEIVTRGGCERSLLALAENFDMDIITNKFSLEKTYEGYKKIKNRIIVLNQKNKLLFGLRLALTKFKGYDIFYSHGYFITNLLALRNKPCIWYCHTPKRNLYHPFKEYYMKRIKNPFERILNSLTLFILSFVDKFLASRMSLIIANSVNIQTRIKTIYGIRAPVVYSTCIDEIETSPAKDYYLAPGRLDPIKRVDLIIEAFNRMPDKKLVIAGSVTDKDYFKKLKKLSNKNIKIFSNVSEKKLKNLYKNCIATLYMPYMEDFGFIPVESMASGKPCIGANEGGLKESIINGKTGLLIKPTVDDIIRAVKWLTLKKADSMKENCLKTAKKFSKENFIKDMRKIFEEIYRKYQK